MIHNEMNLKLFDTLHAGLLIINYETKSFTNANIEMCRMLGYSKEELLGLNITDIHPQESHKHTLKELKKLKNGQKRITKNIPALRKDGSIFYADISTMNIISNDSLCIAGVFIDVSERQKLKKDLTNSEIRYQHLIETIPSVVYIGTLNHHGETLYISPQVKKLYEFSSKKFLNTPGLWFKHIHPDDKILILQKMKAIQNDENISMLEYRIITKSGKIKWVKNRFSLIKNSQGENVYIQGVIHDISEQKRNEAKLLKKSKQQEMLANLGKCILQGDKLEHVFKRSMEQLHEIMDVDYVKILKLNPDKKSFLLLEGMGWKKGYVGNATVDADKTSQAGYTLLQREPVVVEDFLTEERFATPSLLQEHNVVSGMSIRIQGFDNTVFGVLGIHSKDFKLFSDNDIHFLSTVANTLALSIEYISEEKKLHQSNHELHSLSENMLHIREDERSYIAKEVHDELGQLLTVLKMDISWIHKQSIGDNEILEERTSEMISLVDKSLQSVRKIAKELRPHIIDELGLEESISLLVTEYCKRVNLEYNFEFRCKESKLAKGLDITIYRICQEALTNIIRHANAKKVSIELFQENENFVVKIVDDGIGMDVSRIKNLKSFGLLGIKERLYPWNGSLNISGEKDKGTTLIATIPMEWSRENKND